MPQFDELLRQCPKSFDQGCLKTPSKGKRVFFLVKITKLREKLWICRYSNLKKVTGCYLVTIIYSKIGRAQMNGFECMLIKVARLDFLGGYLPSLSINYVAMSKDMEKRFPKTVLYKDENFL